MSKLAVCSNSRLSLVSLMPNTGEINGEDLNFFSIAIGGKSSPFISPVYGISETKETIELEQTANLDKLNEEIKKTNEFLKTLKELQKNLD